MERHGSERRPKTQMSYRNSFKNISRCPSLVNIELSAISKSIVLDYMNARKNEEIIWTKNTTEAINIVAHGLKFEKGDKVITTNLEHTSGMLPWMIKQTKGTIDLDFVLCNEEGEFNVEDFKEKIPRACIYGYHALWHSYTLPAFGLSALQARIHNSITGTFGYIGAIHFK